MVVPSNRIPFFSSLLADKGGRHARDMRPTDQLNTKTKRVHEGQWYLVCVFISQSNNLPVPFHWCLEEVHTPYDIIVYRVFVDWCAYAAFLSSFFLPLFLLHFRLYIDEGKEEGAR